jgi:phage terminase small subunit
MLTPRQQAFVEHYAACGNATEAARRAGYKQPNPQGAENLAKPSIQAAIAERTQAAVSARIATAEERQSFWTAVLRGEEDAEMKDRLKASELLGKCQGDFIDRVESRGVQEIVVRYVQE